MTFCNAKQGEDCIYSCPDTLPCRRHPNSRVIVHVSHKAHQYFFSTHHGQESLAPDTYPHGDWTAVSIPIPSYVVHRPSLPSGIIESREDVVTVYYSTMTEIPNPDPDYQPKEVILDPSGG